MISDNLNTLRYMNTLEQEEPIDLKVVQAEIKTLKGQLGDVEARIAAYLRELGLDE